MLIRIQNDKFFESKAPNGISNDSKLTRFEILEKGQYISFDICHSTTTAYSITKGTIQNNEAKLYMELGKFLNISASPGDEKAIGSVTEKPTMSSTSDYFSSNSTKRVPSTSSTLKLRFVNIQFICKDIR